MALGLGRGGLVAQRHVDHVAEEDEPAYEHHRLPGPPLRVLLGTRTSMSGSGHLDIIASVAVFDKGPRACQLQSGTLTQLRTSVS